MEKWSKCPLLYFEAVSSNLRIHVGGPGIDAAAQAADVFQTVSLEVSRGIETLLAQPIGSGVKVAFEFRERKAWHELVGKCEVQAAEALEYSQRLHPERYDERRWAFAASLLVNRIALSSQRSV